MSHRTRWAGLVSVSIACGAYFVLFVVPLMRSESFSWMRFRNYFPFDQYSYLAIASNVQGGDYRAVEPFTQSGANHYPRLYYFALGALARLFGTDLVLTWQVTGVVLQLVMVAVVAALCIRITRLPWAGVLAVVPFLIGTFAWLESDGWFHTLDSHGVLWPAFGVLFTINGESAALCLAVMAMCAVVHAVQDGTGRRIRRTLIIVAFAVVGSLANVQTYSFLSSVYLLAFAFACYGLIASRGKRAALLSVGLTVVVLLLGPTLADTAGPLVTLASGALGTLPGLLQVFKRHKADFLLATVVLFAFAMPTVLGTILGRASGDPFLTYREASSNDLGVPVGDGISAAIIPIVLLFVIFIGGLVARKTFWVSYSVGAAVAWSITSTNDVWGANQEPYRFWIDCFTVISITAVPICASVVLHFWRRRDVVGGRVTDGGSHERLSRANPPAVVAVAITTIAVALIGLSFPDYVRFSEFVKTRGTVEMWTDQMKAAALVTQDVRPADTRDAGQQFTGTLMFDPCIDPLLLKHATGAPVAFYNLGLAWPTDEPQVRSLLTDRAAGSFDSAKAVSANVTHVLTDSSCRIDWTRSIQGSVINRVQYDTGTGTAELLLWRLDE